jgi:outer membrane protein TolC
MKIIPLYRVAPVLLLLLGCCLAPQPVEGSTGVAAPPATETAGTVMNLDQLLERALRANRSILQNGLQVQSRQYGLRSAESAFDWKVQPVANLGLSKSEDSTEQATGISSEIRKKSSLGIEVSLAPSIAYVKDSGTSSGVGVSLSVPLLRGFGREYNFDSVRAADFALATSTRNVYLAEVDVVLETVTLVYEILRQQELVKLYTLQDKRLQGHAATARIMETTGLSTPIDTYRAEIRLKDVQEQLNVAQERYHASVDRLKVLLAFPMETRLRVEAPLSYKPTRIKMKEAEKIALDNRLEMQQAKADISEASRKSRVAERKLLPDINLVATYRKNTFLEGLSSSELYYGDYWSVGLTSSTDFSRTAEKSAYQQSLLELRRVKLEQQNRRDTIVAEVNKQLTALEKEEHRIALRREQIVQARGKMRLAEIKFSHGMGDNFDLIESETELQRAKTDLLSEKTSYIVGQYRLRAALGTLLKQ